MDLQYVFGNPMRKKGNKKLAPHKKSSKINRKENKIVKIKSVKKRNPVHYKFTKSGVKNRYSKQFMTPGEVGEVKAVINSLKSMQKIAVKQGKPLTNLTKKINRFESTVAKNAEKMAIARDQKAQMTAQGFKSDTVIKKAGPKSKIPTKAKVAAKVQALSKEAKKKRQKKAQASVGIKRKIQKGMKPKRKKAAVKKKAVKKKIVKRRSVVAKKKKVVKKKTLLTKKRRVAIAKKAAKARWAGKKKVTKKKVIKRKKKVIKRKVAKKKVAIKKRKVSKKKSFKLLGSFKKRGKTYKISRNPKRRRNPMKVMDMFKPKNLFSDKGIGWTGVEGLGLMLGGMSYGQVNRYASKIPMIRETLEKIPFFGPVIAPAIPTLLVGAILNILGKKQKIKAIEVLGRGLVGSAIVGIGVNTGEKIPGLASAAPVAGYSAQLGNYDSQMGGSDNQLGEYRESNADFGAVDYTPEMNGVDFTSEESADFGGIDFSPEGEADYGEIPDGLN